MEIEDRNRFTNDEGIAGRAYALRGPAETPQFLVVASGIDGNLFDKCVEHRLRDVVSWLADELTKNSRGATDRSRPLLGAVQYSDDENGVAADSIDDDVRQRRQDELAGSLVFSGPALVWERQQRARRIVDRPHQRRRSFGHVFKEVIGDPFEIGRSFLRPPKLHSG